MNMLHKTGLTNLLFEYMPAPEPSDFAGYESFSDEAAAYDSGLKNPSEYSKQSSADFSKMNDDAITSHIKNEFKEWVWAEFKDCGLEILASQAPEMDDEDRLTLCPPEQQFALLVDAYALMSETPQEIFKGLNQAQTNAAKAALGEIRKEISKELKAGTYDAILLAAPPAPKPPAGSPKGTKPDATEASDWQRIHGDIKKQISLAKQRGKEEVVAATIDKKWQQYSSTLSGADIPTDFQEKEFKRKWKEIIGGKFYADDVETGQFTPRTVSTAVIGSDASSTEPATEVNLTIQAFAGSNNSQFDQNQTARQTYGAAMSAEQFQIFKSQSGWKDKTTRSEAIAGFIMGANSLDSTDPAPWVQGDSVNFDLNVNAPEKLLNGAWEVKQLGAVTGHQMPAASDEQPSFTGREKYNLGSARLGQSGTAAAEAMKGDIRDIARTAEIIYNIIDLVPLQQQNAVFDEFKEASKNIVESEFASNDTIIQKLITGELGSTEGWQSFYGWIMRWVDAYRELRQQFPKRQCNRLTSEEQDNIEAWIMNVGGQDLYDAASDEIAMPDSAVATALFVNSKELMSKLKPSGAISGAVSDTYLRLAYEFETTQAVSDKSLWCILQLELPNTGVAFDILNKYSPKKGFSKHERDPKIIAKMISNLVGVPITTEDGETITQPTGHMSRLESYFKSHQDTEAGGAFDEEDCDPKIDPDCVKKGGENKASTKFGRYKELMRGFVFIYENEPNDDKVGQEGASWIIDVFPREAMFKAARNGELEIGKPTQSKPKIYFAPKGGVSVYQSMAKEALEQAEAPQTQADDGTVTTGGPLGKMIWGSDEGFGSGTIPDIATKTYGATAIGKEQDRPNMRLNPQGQEDNSKWSADDPNRGGRANTFKYDLSGGEDRIVLQNNGINQNKVIAWVKEKTGVVITKGEAQRLLKKAINIKRDANGDFELTQRGGKPRYSYNGDPSKLEKDEWNAWATELNDSDPSKKINLAASHRPEGKRLEEKQSVFDGGSVGRSMGDWIDWSVRRK